MLPSMPYCEALTELDCPRLDEKNKSLVVADYSIFYPRPGKAPL